MDFTDRIAEAEEALMIHQPGLLIVADPLEEGDLISLCRKARQQQPQKVRTVPPALEHVQPAREPQLTPREQEVLDLIGRGLSDRHQPAAQLRNCSQLRKDSPTQAGQQ